MNKAGKKKDSTSNHLSLDVELERRIEAFAQAMKIAPSEVIRNALDAYEATQNGGFQAPSGSTNRETIFDRWTRAGLIGSIDDADLPPDLSTNPEHLEGFGRG